MFYPGLVSISFRTLAPAEIMAICLRAGLNAVEWGTDSHVKTATTAAAVYLEGSFTDILPCSCGSYYKLGVSTAEELRAALEITRALHTDTLRIWGGNRSSAELTESDFEKMVAEGYAAAQMADSYGITLCLECHPQTVTDRYESELRLLNAVAHPRLKTYWQPNQFESIDYNLEAAEALAGDTRMIHVFAWSENERFPLEQHSDIWKRYLSIFSKTGKKYGALLEFMPDNRPESLKREVKTLKKLLSAL